jgi:murein DD-endopeptidase MepM/ murein hydrolase activator NlpD
MKLRLRIGARAILALLLCCACVHAPIGASEYAYVDHDDGYLYRLPYGDDVSYAVIQAWGSPLSHTGFEHYTVDFGMPEGTPVHAARDGIVVGVEHRHEHGCWSKHCEAYANFVAIRHSDGTIGEYFHLQKNGVLVAAGDPVTRGQQIALSGNTGYTNVPHLHFGIYAPAPNGGRRSIDFRFVTSNGIVVRPRAGSRYRTAASRLSVSSR